MLSELYHSITKNYSRFKVSIRYLAKYTLVKKNDMLHILEVLDPLKNIIGHKIWYAYKIVVLKFGINICISTASIAVIFRKTSIFGDWLI